MRNLVMIMMAALFVFGCAGEQPSADTDGAPPAPILPTEPPAGECEAQYSFSELEDGIFSKEESLVATVTCAADKTFSLKIDGAEIVSKSPESNGTTPLEFAVPAIKDGTLKVSIESDGETLYSRDWEVAPLGNQDTFGKNYEAFSFKEWLAMAFDIENEVDVGQIKVFMKRQSPAVQKSSMVVLEIREDSSGEPGKLVLENRISIEEPTLSENWIRFNYDDRVKLSEGRYWVVLKVDQTEEISLVSDVVTVHYMVIDREAEGNDYTRKMLLSVDEKTGEATETSWEPLSYDREFNILLSYGK